MNDLAVSEIQEVEVEIKEVAREVPEFYANNYWKLEGNESIDDLMADYQ